MLCRGRLVRQCAVKSFSDDLELRFQRPNFLVLSKYYVAHLGYRAFEMGDF